MSKSQNGNKEAKKPKQVKPVVNPLAPVGSGTAPLLSVADRVKKKK